MRLLLFFVLLLTTTNARATSLILQAADGVRVSAEEYAPEKANGGIVLLFHQAGSNRGEYATIAPRLTRLGFRCLAIDQRSGGAKWGRPNETVLRLGASTDYLSALTDLQAAVDWAVAQKPRRVLVMGSSYSAALVFLLASKNSGKLAGVLSFSPGEYLGTMTMVRDAAKSVRVPVFITSASDRGEILAARQIFAAVPTAQKTQYIPRKGIHGASTLRPDRNQVGEADTWRAVAAFLKKNRFV